MQVVVSPELALVDPDLREAALARLPRVEPFDFLRLRDLPPPSAAARPLAAAAVYFALAVLRTCAFNAFVFASVFALVLLLNKLG